MATVIIAATSYIEVKNLAYSRNKLNAAYDLIINAATGVVKKEHDRESKLVKLGSS